MSLDLENVTTAQQVIDPVVVTADAVVVPTGVSATGSVGSITTRTSNIIPITTPALSVAAGSPTVNAVNFDYESIKDSYDRRRVLHIGATSQRFTVSIGKDLKDRTVFIAPVDKDNTIRIAA